MRLVGIVVVLLGWVVAVAGLFVSSANPVRLAFACAGIAITLFGSLGILNGYYLERAIWKR